MGREAINVGDTSHRARIAELASTATPVSAAASASPAVTDHLTTDSPRARAQRSSTVRPSAASPSGALAPSRDGARPQSLAELKAARDELAVAHRRAASSPEPDARYRAAANYADAARRYAVALANNNESPQAKAAFADAAAAFREAARLDPYVAFSDANNSALQMYARAGDENGAVKLVGELGATRQTDRAANALLVYANQVPSEVDRATVRAVARHVADVGRRVSHEPELTDAQFEALWQQARSIR